MQYYSEPSFGYSARLGSHQMRENISTALPSPSSANIGPWNSNRRAVILENVCRYWYYKVKRLFTPVSMDGTNPHLGYHSHHYPRPRPRPTHTFIVIVIVIVIAFFFFRHVI